jgi:hypothetical protein
MTTEIRELTVALGLTEDFLRIHRSEANKLHRTEQYSDRLDSAESGLDNLFALNFWAYDVRDRKRIARAVRAVARATKQARHAQIGMYHDLHEQLLAYAENHYIDLGPHV